MRNLFNWISVNGEVILFIIAVILGFAFFITLSWLYFVISY